MPAESRNRDRHAFLERISLLGNSFVASPRHQKKNPKTFDCYFCPRNHVESRLTFNSEEDIRNIRSQRKTLVLSGSSDARPKVPNQRYLTRPLLKSVSVDELKNPVTENGLESNLRPIIRRAANVIQQNKSRGQSPSRAKVRAISKLFH